MIDCSKCPEPGSCCGPFPMDKSWAEKHKDKFQVTPEKTIERGEKIVFVCEDFLCPFLNRETKKCAVYEDRPKVCKLFGEEILPCPFFKRSGNPRSNASKKKVDKLYNQRLNKMEELAE